MKDIVRKRTWLTSFWLLLIWITPAQATYIVVDTGHTAQRPGATGANGRAEYLYNLDTSNALAGYLTAMGTRVIQVAADGKEIKLAERATQTPDADLFVSIHHDSIQQAWIDAGRREAFSGFSIFVSEKNADFDQSLACAKRIGARLIAAGEHPSLYHATPIPGENRPLLNASLGIHRFDDLVVLKTAPIPAVLIEVGVIANPQEADRLNRPEVIQRLAKAIAAGISECTAK